MYPRPRMQPSRQTRIFATLFSLMGNAGASLLGYIRVAVDWILGVDFVRNVVRDLKSLRALWNYIFMALYVWASCYLVLFHAETCGSTVIMSTAGIVSVIFTNYVFSSYMDRKNGLVTELNLIPGAPIPTGRPSTGIPPGSRPDSQDD